MTVVNRLAPEHASVVTRGAARVARQIVAGAVFVGRFSPVAAGDYGIGPNHVLPTGGTARFASPLSVRDFQRRQSRRHAHAPGPGARDRGHRAGRDGRGLPRSRAERAHAIRGRVMDPLRHVKPAVRALRAYTLVERDATVKINQNENPCDLPEALKRRVLEQALARPWSRYPDFDPSELLARARGLLRLARRRDPGRQRLERADRGAAGRDGRRRHARRDPGADVHALRPAHDGPRRGSGQGSDVTQGGAGRVGGSGRPLPLRHRGPSRSAPRERRVAHDRVLAQQPDRHEPVARTRSSGCAARATAWS